MITKKELAEFSLMQITNSAITVADSVTHWAERSGEVVVARDWRFQDQKLLISMREALHQTSEEDLTIADLAALGVIATATKVLTPIVQLGCILGIAFQDKPKPFID